MRAGRIKKNRKAKYHMETKTCEVENRDMLEIVESSWGDVGHLSPKMHAMAKMAI